jgi:hypothetical protein
VFAVLVVELDLADDPEGADALVEAAHRVGAVLPVAPRRVWAGIGATASAVAAMHDDS